MTFIVIDGPDGSGTTRHSEWLSEHLTKEDMEVLHTFEPSDGPVGQSIREDLVSGKEFTAIEIQTRFCEDRMWHIKDHIQPALDAGKAVVCDRYIPSTICYGLAQGIDRRTLEKLNAAFIQPDITFFLLPPFRIALERIESRLHKDVFEEEEFQRSVYDQYATLAKEDPSIHVIDTSGKKSDVAELIFSIVMAKIAMEKSPQ